jgi:outer membrane protein OmpA-like peptidoglycan-associated protein
MIGGNSTGLPVDLEGWPEPPPDGASMGTPSPVSEPAARLRHFRNVLLGVAVATALAVFAYLLWTRLGRMEGEIAQLSRQLQDSTNRLDQVSARSEAASIRATQAEEHAAEAARLRDQAEAARAQSEKAANQALGQAVVAQQEASQARRQAQELLRERQAALDHLQQVLGHIAETRRTENGVVMSLGSNYVRFDFDKSTLRPENRELLSRVAGVLMTLKGYQVYIYGYTDDIGTEQYNQGLSERRAESVRDYFVRCGLDPGMLSTKGYGEADPLVKGSSVKARAQNRRVEIGIVDSVLRMQCVVEPYSPGENK